jgi:hypothetical protein
MGVANWLGRPKSAQDMSAASTDEISVHPPHLNSEPTTYVETKNGGIRDGETLLPSDSDLERQRMLNPTPFLDTDFRKSLKSFSWIIHLLALGATAAAIHLPFANVYWADEQAWQNTRLLGLKGQEIADGLQFASKVYEIIITMSICEMLLHVLRRMLLGRGIPWGLMSGIYQAGAPLYIFSRELWSPMLKPKKGRFFFLAFVLFILVLYLNTLGPFAAIVIIPVLDWWPVSNPYNGEKLISFIYATPEETYLKNVNQVITGEYSDTNEVYLDCVDFGTANCPDGGMQDVRSLLQAFALNNAKPEAEIKQNGAETTRLLTSTLDYATDNEHLALATTLQSSIVELAGSFWNQVNSTETGYVNKVGRPKISPKDNNVFAPLVQVQCSQYSFLSLRENNETPKFQTSRMRNFSGYAAGSEKKDWYRQRQEWTIPSTIHAPYWPSLDDLQTIENPEFIYGGNDDDDISLDYFWTDEDRNRSFATFQWIDAARVFPEEQPSLAALITVPMAKLVSGAPSDPDALWQQDSVVLPCMIDAHWAGSSTSYDPSSDKLLPNNLTEFKNLKPFWDKKDPTKDILNSKNAQISSGWAEYLNRDVENVTFGEGFESAGPAMLWIMDDFVKPEPGLEGFQTFMTAKYNATTDNEVKYKDAANVVSTILSLAIAEGLSRVSFSRSLGIELKNYNNGTSLTKQLYQQSGGGQGARYGATQEDTASLEQLTRVEWKVERRGMGYGLKSPNVVAGIALLLLHAAAVVLFSIWTLAFRMRAGGWANHDWAGTSELVALGLLSRTPEDLDTVTKIAAGEDKWNTMTTIATIRSVNNRTVELGIGKARQASRLRKGAAYSY